MGKYVLTFEKKGDIKYISHLDLMRLFKRLFNRTGVDIAYSQGFNPHPKMRFSQPLSLGYTSTCEMLEFETKSDKTPGMIEEMIRDAFPSGLYPLKIEQSGEGKSLAARCYAADYLIKIPDEDGLLAASCKEKGIEDFLAQEKILVKKKKKKSEELIDTNIKDMIRNLTLSALDNTILLSTTLDAGSTSNLSPELLLQALFNFWDIKPERETLEIQRSALHVK